MKKLLNPGDIVKWTIYTDNETYIYRGPGRDNQSVVFNPRTGFQFLIPNNEISIVRREIRSIDD